MAILKADGFRLKMHIRADYVPLTTSTALRSMQPLKHIIQYTLALIFLQSYFLQIVQAQTKVVYQEKFTEKSLSKNWEQVNGNWTIKNDTLYGERNREWAVLIAKKSLPENYILSFSMLADPKAYLFELMTNLNDNHFLGILLNQLENRVAIEDRAFFPKGDEMGSHIHTKGHIGRLPKVTKAAGAVWIDWKVQKTGNQIFIWMNDEEIISLKDTMGIAKPKGKFGFAINGKAKIKSVMLLKTKGEASLPPPDFKGRALIRPSFSFSE